MPISPTLIDVDLDGKVDIVMGLRSGGLQVLYQITINDDDVDFNVDFIEKSATTEVAGLANIMLSAGYSAPVFADIVGADGLADLILGGADGKIKVFQASRSNVSGAKNGSMMYTELTDILNPFAGIQVPSYSKPAVADLDGDGNLDLLVGASDGMLRAFINQITASSWSSEILLGVKTSNFSSPTFVDFNGDGDVDLAVGDLSGRLHLFHRLRGAFGKDSFSSSIRL